MPDMPRSLCPISLALDIFGDAWTLLIVRDLMFKGVNTFNGFLNSGEGIATNVLADRLAKLEKAALIAKTRDADDARRFVYSLTPKGADLAPMLVQIVLWSARHTETDAPREQVSAIAADPVGFAELVRQSLRQATDSA